MASVYGTSGNDFIHVAGDGLPVPPGDNDIPLATNGDDVIHPGYGIDTISAGGGDDFISMGPALTAADSIDGGTGYDTVSLNGDYTGANAVVFSATTMVNVEQIQLVAGHSYDLTTDDATVASGQTLELNAHALGTGDSVIFDGSAETDGSFRLLGGAGNDSLTGGAGNDFFVPGGGADIVQGGGGNDFFDFQNSLTAADTVDGGSGYDTVYIYGNSYAAGLTFSATTMVNVEKLVLGGGYSYALTTDDATVAAGQFLTVDASALAVNNTLNFNGAAETDGHFIILAGAGTSTLIGGAHSDEFVFSNGFSAADSVNGAGGNDTIIFNTDLSAGVTFNPSTMSNVENMDFDAGHNYGIVLADGNLTEGQTLTVDASALGSANFLNFNGGLVSDGNLNITGGAGADILRGGSQTNTIDGGAGNDTIYIDRGGNNYIDGGSGNDTFIAGAAFATVAPASHIEQIDGGSGNDTLILDGNYSTTNGTNGLEFGPNWISNIDTIDLVAGNNYYIILNNNVAAGQTMTIDASTLDAGNNAELLCAGETDGHLVLLGGAGADVLAGGAQADVLDGGAGADQLTGGGGADVFRYQAVSDSTSVNFDVIKDFNAATDTFDLPVTVSAVDPTVDSGQLRGGANFDSDLATDVGAAQLAAGHAVVYTPAITGSAGDLQGSWLIVDANGVAGYQAGADYVIQIGTPETGVPTLTTANFI